MKNPRRHVWATDWKKVGRNPRNGKPVYQKAIGDESTGSKTIGVSLAGGAAIGFTAFKSKSIDLKQKTVDLFKKLKKDESNEKTLIKKEVDPEKQ